MNRQRVKEVLGSSGLIVELARIVGDYASEWLYVVGGAESSGLTCRMMDRWDGDRWRVMAPLPNPIQNPFVCWDPRDTTVNRLLVFHDRVSCISPLYVYDCTKNEWLPKERFYDVFDLGASATFPSSGIMLAAIGEFFYFLRNCDDVHPSFQQFSLQTSTWRKLPLLLEDHHIMDKLKYGIIWSLHGLMKFDAWRNRIWIYVADRLAYFDIQTEKWFDGPSHVATHQGILTPTQYRQHISKLGAQCTWVQDDFDSTFAVPSGRYIKEISVLESHIVVVNFRFYVYAFDLFTETWSAIRVDDKDSVHNEASGTTLGCTFTQLLMINPRMPPWNLQQGISDAHTWSPYPTTLDHSRVPPPDPDRARAHFSLFAI